MAPQPAADLFPEARNPEGTIVINDLYPRATTNDGSLQTEADWKVERTLIRKGASIGSGATILANVTIGENALVGAGSIVTKDVAAGATVVGNPASPRPDSNSLFNC